MNSNKDRLKDREENSDSNKLEEREGKDGDFDKHGGVKEIK